MRRRLLLSLLLLIIPLSLALAGDDEPEPIPDPPLPTTEPPLFPAKLGPITVTEVPTPLPSLSAQTCNACHGELHDQWAASGHAAASTDPIFLAARAALGEPALCDDCHLPLEVQRPRLVRGPGGGRVANPAYDPTLMLEGVTCAVCHVRDGEIVGPRTLAVGQAPHAVRASRALSTPEACAFCHQANLHPDGPGFLDTMAEWERSPFGQAGVSCQQCHMPRVSGVIAGSRYAAFASHGWTGGRDPRAMARALTLQVNLRSVVIQRGDVLRATATVMNTGAGHAVPTGDPSHRLELSFTVEDAAGALPEEAEPSSTWFGREMKPEPPFEEISDDRLQPGGQRQVDYAYQAHKKSDPGRYTLVVSLVWWAVSAEQAEAYGLAPDDVRIVVAEQRIPFDVN